MYISIAEPPEIAYFTPAPITSLEGMAELCNQMNFSPALFKNGKRNLASFEKAYCIGLDVDNDGRTPLMTLDEAKVAFKDYTHLILPSRSHQIEKDGRVCDRFRIILFFTEPITDIDTFYATWFWCKEQWPAIDPQCKDPSRFYYKHSAISSLRKNGTRITPVAPKPKEMTKGNVDLSRLSEGERGKLSRDTLEFLLVGTGKGDRNGKTYKAAKEFQQNLYPFEEAVSKITELLLHTETISSDFTQGEVEATVRSAYNTEAKHDPRIVKKAFDLVRLDELYKTTRTLEWITEGLLTVGGVSLMSSDPKAGKSTLVRQLMRDVLRGGQFLGRHCKQGVVHYYAIEEQLEVVNASFKRLGLTNKEPLFVHVGDPLAETKMEDFRELLLEHRPVLAVIDTLFDFLDVESENNYKEVKRELRRIRNVARETGTHILLVHHNSKGNKDDRRRGNRGILGSQAIAGGVDTIMVLEVEGTTRLMSSTGREIRRWSNRELVFNQTDCTYTLGAEVDEFA
jgi:hypothetical protein